MSFWETNSVILGVGSLVGGGTYFAIVFWQSLSLGALAPPSLIVWLGCLALQFLISVFGVFFITDKAEKALVKDIPGGTDERDQIIRVKSEAWQGHVMSALIFVCMAAWFAHGSSAIFFHSLVGALTLSELARCGVQVFNYNRAY